MIGEPPSEAGARKSSATEEELTARSADIVGESGALAAGVPFTEAEGRLVPFALIARTLIAYVVPLVRPLILNVEIAPEAGDKAI